MKVTDIKPEVFAMAQRVQAKLGERFAEIDAVAEENTRRVMTAFQDNRVSDACFAGTTGYGYDDLGRETLDKIYAQIFGAEGAAGLLAHAQELKAAGAKYCDCPACAAAAAILEKKDELL